MNAVARPVGERAIPRPSERRGRRAPRRRGPSWWGVGGALAALVALALYAHGAFVSDDRSPVGLVFAALILLAAPSVLGRLGRIERSFDLAGIMSFGLGLKLVATHFRFRAAADSIQYDRVGRDLAEHFRGFDFAVDPGRSVPGTGAVRYLTGLVHLLTGSDYFATFLLFSLMGWGGVYFFYRAFAAGLPDGRRKRYAVLVFCWPTLLYWPSSIGKEAPMLMTLGLASWGAARLLSRHRGGLALLASGLFTSALIRPHVTLIVVAAVLVALTLRAPIGDSLVATIAKLGAIAVLVVAASLVVSATEDALGIDNLSSGFDEASSRTSQGGSEFSADKIDSILEVPSAALTVLFRPWPTEAHSAEALLTSLEGMGLLAMLVVTSPALGRSLLRLRQRAYVAYALVYIAVFVYLFSVIANFGILTRQRSQVIPLVLALVALPVRRPAGRSRRRRRRVAP